MAGGRPHRPVAEAPVQQAACERCLRSVGRLGFALLLVLSRVNSVSAAGTNELSDAARQLGASAFRDRNAAGDRLLKAGTEAIPYLREATGSDSPEVRFRATELLQRIEMQVLESQKAAILSGELESGFLPCWDRYQDLVGDSDGARRLFIGMLDRSPRLMQSIGQPEFSETLDRRLNEWISSVNPWQRSRGPDATEELAAILLAACQPESGLSQQQAQYVSRSAESPWFSLQLSTDRGEALKTLLSAWIIQPGRNTAEARLHLAQHYQLSQGVEPARELISQETTGLEIVSAILYLSNQGDDSDVPRLEKLLANQTELQTFRSQKSPDALKTKVCDVALVALWKKCQESPTAHGMPEYVERNGFPTTGTIGFRNDEDRRSAILQWQTWRKQNVKSDLPVDGWAIEGRVT